MRAFAPGRESGVVTRSLCVGNRSILRPSIGRWLRTSGSDVDTTINEADIRKLGYVRQPDGSYARPALATGVLAAKPEPAAQSTLGHDPQTQARSATRRRVRITIHTTRLRDPDNSCVKFVVDALRYEGLIP